jgi:quercetin dioxygenase-like cupin family protein
LTPIKDIGSSNRQDGDDRYGLIAPKEERMAKNDSSRKPEPLACDRGSTLTDLVDIAQGSIVSRVLASSTGGNVTLFAFDAGQGLSEHTAPFDALVQTVSGSIDLTIGDDEVHLRPGEVVRMPANVPHALHAPEPCRMLLTMLREPKAEV